MLVCQAFRTTRFTKPLSLVVMEVHAHHYNAIASRMNQMKCFPGDKIQEGGPNGPAGIQQCAGCGGQIVERWLLLAMDRYWHNGCLKCSYCGAALAEIGHSCYTRGGMILCKSDYKKLFGGSGACAGCGMAIPASELVMRAGGSVFHQKCFTCSKCGRELVPGDRYYLLSGSPVCETDWHKIVKSSSVAAAAAAAAAGNGGAPVRKGKVGRPRRSRE